MRDPALSSALLPASARLSLAALLLAGLGVRAADPNEQTITLDPFEVKTDSDQSYGALSSRSITAFNTQLDRIPVTADIFDQAFMKDVGATSLEDTLQYSAGTGATGLGAAGTANLTQPGDVRNQSYIQIRGMMTPNMQRDSLMYTGTFGNPSGTGPGRTSNFDLERVEVIFGPQAMLYDGGGAGGVINAVSKQARLGAPAFGAEDFRIDQYGTKYNTFDFGTGNDHFAVRVAGVNSSDATRRDFLGDHLAGLYAQFAVRLGQTTVRVSLEQTYDYAITSSQPTLTSAGDPDFKQFNGYELSYLVATGQAGNIAGGLNWNNAGSTEGSVQNTRTVAEFGEIEADTRWSDRLSTQITAGLSGFSGFDTQNIGSITFYSPGATSNPSPGDWTDAMSANFSANVREKAFHGKALRGSVLLTNDLFGGKAKSQSILGLDYIGSWGEQVPLAYYLADSNWNVLTGSGTTATAGRTVLPALQWNIDHGPIHYPFFNIGSPRITWNGQNYVLQQVNPLGRQYVTPADPEGALIIGGQDDVNASSINEGIYGTNSTQWDEGRLDTLLGIRLEHQYRNQLTAPGAGPNPLPFKTVDSHNFNFSAGTDYHVRPWLTPYVSVSNSFLVMPQQQRDPSRQVLPISEGLGEEAGLKFANAAQTLSGSIAYYHNQAKNEEFEMTAGLLNDIAPTGLNGRPSGAGQFYVADTEADGVQLTATASPVKNWRLRLSASVANGRVQTTKTYAQYYDDQFYENSAGQVTYADGAVVYVAPTFNSKTPAYTAANAPAGSVPLTTAKLSNPADLYYSNPNLTSGAIATGSDGGKVLQASDPIHGTILTGANGLPISALQLMPSSIPGLAVPGTIPAAISGQHTTGYPELSAVFTSVYQFDRGWLKGVEAGGTVRLGWRDISYYYYPSGLGSGTVSFAEIPFDLPNFALFDPILGFSHKFRSVTFNSRLNVYNVFNHYHVVVYPGAVSGWSNPANLTAGFDQEPRRYVWTNTVQF